MTGTIMPGNNVVCEMGRSKRLGGSISEMGMMVPEPLLSTSGVAGLFVFTLSWGLRFLSSVAIPVV